VERVRLTLHEQDPITGDEEALFTLFYEAYRGYTIYSTPQGQCCLHGRQGCLRLQGRYVCFPEIEEAKAMVKRFRAAGHTSQETMNRFLAEEEYLCLNSSDPPQRNDQRPRVMGV